MLLNKRLVNLENDMHQMCREKYFSLPRAVDKYCDDSICNFLIDNSGLSHCQCHPLGAMNKTCHPHGGKCECKPNVFGKNCNECKPNAWGFSSQGCHCKI